MNEKEKAKELVDRFLEITPINASFDDTVTEANEKIFADIRLAKQCALICVDEILNLSSHFHIGNVDGYLDCYEEIKQEINKL